MPPRLLTNEEELVILKKVAEVTEKINEPVALWKFWARFTKEQNIEHNVRYIYNRFRSLLRNRAKTKEFDLDTRVRMFFTLSVPFDHILQMEVLEAGCTLEVDPRNQINKYENPATGLKLSAFDEQGNLFTVRRNGRSINPHQKEPRAKKRKTMSSENPEDTSELQEDFDEEVIYENSVFYDESWQDSEGGTYSETPGAQSFGIPMKLDIAERFSDDGVVPPFESKPLCMFDFNPTTSENSEALQNLNMSQMTSQEPDERFLNVRNVLKKLKFLVLSLGCAGLAELRKQIGKALEKTEHETILASEISDFLGMSLKICQLSVTDKTPESLEWKRFLEIFEISLLSSNNEEFGELAEQVRRMIVEIHGDMRIPTSSVQLAIENIIEMMTSQ